MLGDKFAADCDCRTLSTMATILRFGTLFLLLVCLANMVTANGQSLRLLSLQRTESADKMSFTFTTKFRADNKPTADWWEYIHSSRNPLSGSTLDYDESTKEGTTSATLAKDPYEKDPGRNLILDLGDKGSQYFYLWWKTTGEGDLNYDLDLPVSDVTPSTDVPYSSGELTQVRIEVNKNGSNGFTFPVMEMLIKDAYYHNLTKEAVVRFPNRWTFLKLGQYVVLSVHEDKYTGPFPDEHVHATWIGDRKGCLVSPSYRCLFACKAFGNNINSMEVYKLGKDGTSTPVEKTKLTSWKTTKYYWTSYLELNTTEDFEGTYVCRVTGDGGKAETKVQQKVARVERAPKIQAFTNKTLADGNIILTCTAEGTGPLTVKLEADRVVLQQGKDGVVSYSPGGPSAEGCDDTVTASAVVQASSRSYVCRARNLAASDSRSVSF